MISRVVGRASGLLQRGDEPEARPDNFLAHPDDLIVSVVFISRTETGPGSGAENGKRHDAHQQ